MSNTTRTLIASALTLGLALSSSAAFAKDPAAKSPPTSAHPATHADRHDSNEPVTDTWITTEQNDTTHDNTTPQNPIEFSKASWDTKTLFGRVHAA